MSHCDEQTKDTGIRGQSHPLKPSQHFSAAEGRGAA